MINNLIVGDIISWTTKQYGKDKIKTGRIVRFFTSEESASYLVEKEFGATHKRTFAKCFASRPGVLVEDIEPTSSNNKIKMYKPYIKLIIKKETVKP